MRQRDDRPWLVASLVLVVGLAGCLGDVPSPTALPTGSGVAVQLGVDDPERHVVQVTEEHRDGAPIPNATVVFFRESPDQVEAHEYYVIDPEELPCDAPTDLEASPYWEVLAVGTTDADGRIVGLLDPDVPWVSVAVGGVEGFTTEAHVWGKLDRERWDRVCFRAGLPPTPTDVIPLYPKHAPVSMQGVMEPAVSPTSPGDGVDLPPNWDAQRLVLLPNEIENSAYTLRIDHLDLELSWNNTATEYGDLYLAASASGHFEEAAVSEDHQQLPASGASRETLTWDVNPWNTSWVVVGPATNTTVVAADGLPWRVTGTATLVDAPVVLPEVG